MKAEPSVADLRGLLDGRHLVCPKCGRVVVSLLVPIGERRPLCRACAEARGRAA